MPGTFLRIATVTVLGLALSGGATATGPTRTFAPAAQPTLRLDRWERNCG